MHALTALRDRSAMAMVEFAMILPAMLLLWLGTVEIATMLMVKSRVRAASQVAADTLTRETCVDTAMLDDVVKGVHLIIAPYPSVGVSVRMASIGYDADGSTTILWEDGFQDGLAQKTNLLNQINDLSSPGRGLIVAEVAYHYGPETAFVLKGLFDLDDVALMRPRKSETIPNTGC